MSVITQEEINEKAAELRKLRKDFKAQNARLTREATMKLGEVVAKYFGADDVEAIEAEISKFEAKINEAEEAAKRSADDQQSSGSHDYNGNTGYGY